MQAGHFVAYRTQPERLTDCLPLLVSRHRIRNLFGYRDHQRPPWGHIEFGDRLVFLK